MKKIVLLLAFYFSAWTFGYCLNPTKEYKEYPDKYNIKFEEKKVKTKDGFNLNAWVLPATVKTSKTVLFAHNGEGNMADYIQRLSYFLSLGVNVIAFDYRGFGKSDDFKIDKNMYIYPEFVDDMNAMIDFYRNTYVGSLYVYGFGVGAGLAIGVAWHRPEVTKIIADTPFMTLEGLEKKFSALGNGMIVPLAGYEKKYEPFYTIDNPKGKILTQLLIIIAEKDGLMTVDEMNKFRKKNTKTTTEIFVIKGSDGKDNFTPDKTRYFSKITPFIKE